MHAAVPYALLPSLPPSFLFMCLHTHLVIYQKHSDEKNPNGNTTTQVAWSTQPIKSGVFAGSILDGPGILAISKLPTKQELMQRLAIALKSVPTKVARSINLVPTKVGRVVKLAFAEGEGGEGAAEASPEIEASAVEEPAADAAQEGGDGEAAVTEVVEEAPATPEAEAGAEEAPAAE